MSPHTSNKGPIVPVASAARVTVARTAFLDGLKAVALVASSREKALPISRCVLIAPDGEGLRLTGTDFDRTISILVPAEGVEDFPARAVPCHRLVAIFEQLAHGSVNLAPIDNGVRVTAGRARFDVVGIAADEFPDAARERGAPTSVTVDAPAFVAALLRCVACASNHESRQTLRGVHVKAAANERLYVEGCDGFQANREWVERGSGPALDILIPSPSIAIIAKLFADAETLMVDLTEQRATVASDSALRFETHLVDGPYPDTTPLYGRDMPREAVVDRVQLLAAVRRVAALSTDEKLLVGLEWGPDAVVVSGIGYDEIGNSEDAIPCTTTGSGTVRMAFAQRLLIQALSLRTAETIRVGIKSPTIQISLRDDTSAVVQGVVMPRRDPRG